MLSLNWLIQQLLLAQSLAISFASTASNTINFDGDAETNGTVSVTGANGIDTIIGTAGNDTITGGSAADILTLTAGGSDVIDITATNQGGASVAGNSGATLATGDVITGFASTDDSVDLDGPISNTVSATEGSDANFEAADGLGVITTNFDFSGTQTAAGILASIAGAFGDVTINDGATVFFLIADDTVVAGDGSNLFR